MNPSLTLRTGLLAGKKMAGEKWANRSSIFCRLSFCRSRLTALLLAPLASQSAEPITNSIGTKFVPLEPGTCTMGQDGPPIAGNGNMATHHAEFRAAEWEYAYRATVQTHRDKFAIWTGQDWKTVENVNLARGQIADGLRPLTDADGNVTIRLFLDYWRMTEFKLTLPVQLAVCAQSPASMRVLHRWKPWECLTSGTASFCGGPTTRRPVARSWISRNCRRT